MRVVFEQVCTFWSSSTVVGRVIKSDADLMFTFRWLTAESSVLIYRERKSYSLNTALRLEFTLTETVIDRNRDGQTSNHCLKNQNHFISDSVVSANIESLPYDLKLHCSRFSGIIKYRIAALRITTVTLRSGLSGTINY